MSRAARLLDLLQLLRRHKSPVAGVALAAELGISIRTLYRDIATLQAEGADIQGEPGLGYVLRPGFTLPPLMFSAEEIEALALGARWVSMRGDTRLGPAAENAVAKIRAVLPKDLRGQRLPVDGRLPARFLEPQGAQPTGSVLSTTSSCQTGQTPLPP